MKHFYLKLFIPTNKLRYKISINEYNLLVGTYLNIYYELFYINCGRVESTE